MWRENKEKRGRMMCFMNKVRVRLLSFALDPLFKMEKVRKADPGVELKLYHLEHDCAP